MDAKKVSSIKSMHKSAKYEPSASSGYNSKEFRKLSIVNRVIEILNDTLSMDDAIQQICYILPNAYSYPEYVHIRIEFNSKSFISENFQESSWIERQTFEYPGKEEGAIEIIYSQKFIELDEKEFLVKDPCFLKNIASLITGALSRNQLLKLQYDNVERVKELTGIHRTTQIFKKGATLEEALQEICSFLPEAWQYPQYTAARIIFDDKVFNSRKFRDTPWVQRQNFETSDNKEGTIEIYYLKEFPEADEGPFLKEERNLLDNLSALISGMASKKALQQLLIQNTERLKELRGINQTSAILKQTRSMEESLQVICSILPEAWQYPEHTVARIKYEDKIFESSDFKETPWVQKQEFEAPGNKKGTIEIYYLTEFPDEDEGPFLAEERNLLINLSNLIAGSATKEVLNRLTAENRERLKELKAINQTSQIIAKGFSLEDTLQKICYILPKSWQYPRYTAVRIEYEDNIYTSKNFEESYWCQKENFVTIDNNKGSIEVFYLKEFPTLYEGPFLKEERQLLINISKLISGYINNFKGRKIYHSSLVSSNIQYKSEEFRNSLVRNKQPLQLFFNKQLIDKYIYLDMMKYKIKDILFVATLYDAFILENEDSFFEQFMGEIYQYSLFSLPRITGVTSPEEAMELLETSHFDLVILMVGLDAESPVELSKKMKSKQPDLTIYLLLNQKSNIKYFEELVPSLKSVDNLFVWNGDSQVFFAIVKSIEDRVNVENDTKIGLVRIILLIEDSSQYYSKYLPILYSILFDQVQQSLAEVEKNELDKICKMRSRAKIIHARNYEDAIYIYNKYKDFLLCVISDVEFERDGKTDKTAGIKFIKYVKSHLKNLPIVLQSSEPANEEVAGKLGVAFINKYSESLLSDLKKFLTLNLRFGHFIFRDKDGNPIAVAKTLREFETLFNEIPEESLYVHGIDNQFSLWLMARGEIQLAKSLNPVHISDFENLAEFRKFFLYTLKRYREEKKRGKILSFEETAILDEKNIVSFSSGSLGGKGRGLAFINTLIYNLDFSALAQKINIRTPITVIIGTDEYEYFMEKNRLYDKLFNQELPYYKIRLLFMEGHLSPTLKEKLKAFIEQVNKPIAVRSSSLFEDSLTQPFAGVFDTYIVPNSSSRKKVTLNRLVTAIKLVFASVFSDKARSYFKAIHHKIEEERMGVILQELVGNQFDNYYYPHISGIAQSFNYYPMAHMKPEEGFAVGAIGLGTYVVGGRKSFRFSPRYPKTDMYTTKDLLNSTQVAFYALDISKKKIDFTKDGELASLALLDISEAEKHGTIKHCVSVYNPDNDRIEPGLSPKGPRIVNFADILKFNYIPLSETIDTMLNTAKEALGSPIEIEYAVDLNKGENDLPTFYLLQIKPLVGNQLSTYVDIGEIDKSKTILYTRSSLGNGRLDYIRDVIFVNVSGFNKLKTLDMVNEIAMLNKTLQQQNREYVLIGPGRWGTRDRFLGIPVDWSQISNAKVIVEVSLSNFPLDTSLGSHFFYNVTSMNIGYFSVQDSSKTDFIKWNILNKQKVIHSTQYFTHVRFRKPVEILMNGKQRTSAIICKD
ncbi:MAG: hypothetical protein JXJ22_12060 [Bacteroidales bacterium]|nr:hypothetical protein [Bacteroidales bacterium]